MAPKHVTLMYTKLDPGIRRKFWISHTLSANLQHTGSYLWTTEFLYASDPPLHIWDFAYPELKYSEEILYDITAYTTQSTNNKEM